MKNKVDQMIREKEIQLRILEIRDMIINGDGV